LCYYEYNPQFALTCLESYGSEVVLFSFVKQQRRNGFKQVLFIIKKKFRGMEFINPILLKFCNICAIPIFLWLVYLRVLNVLATVHQLYTSLISLFSKIVLRISAKLCTVFIVVSENAEKLVWLFILV
jgi:hypothetical protein